MRIVTNGNYCIKCHRVGDFDPAANSSILREALSGWSARQSYARIPKLDFPNVPGGMQKILTPDKANAVYMAGMAFPMKDSDPDYPGLLTEARDWTVFAKITSAIAAYERSGEVCKFTSKFDDFWRACMAAGIKDPASLDSPQNPVGVLTPMEYAGFQLFKGKGNCPVCHLLDNTGRNPNSPPDRVERLPGGLLHTNIVGCTVFAAVLRALAGADVLKKTPIADYNDLLEKGNAPDTYRPTLYDFLACNALEFYSAGEQAGE